MKLEEARQHIDSKVVYTSPGSGKKETGAITKVNNTYVFVKFGHDWQVKATHASDLELLEGEE